MIEYPIIFKMNFRKLSFQPVLNNSQQNMTAGLIFQYTCIILVSQL